MTMWRISWPRCPAWSRCTTCTSGALSTTETALTAHLVCADVPGDHKLHDVTHELRDRFGIGHATLQVETGADAELCRLRPHDVV